MKNVTIVGIGYVGLPLALYASKIGYNVFGYDKDKEKVKLANQKVNYLDDELVEDLIKKDLNFKATYDPKCLSKSEIIIVCVPTPVKENHEPNFGPLVSSINEIKGYVKENTTIVIESTISPGTMENVVKPILERDFDIGKNLFLAHCPERIDPGNQKYNVSNIPRVLGAFSEEGLEKSYEFYSNVLESEVRKMNSIREAEAVKILENSFRDINIAFINEIAKSFEKLDIDTIDVIEGAKTKPFAFMAHYPGCGVGGHCIPVDPYYLIERAKENGFDHKFLKLAREINESMPKYTVNKFLREMNKIEEFVKGKNVALLGLSYKKNVSDIRESPSFDILEELNELGANVIKYDPHYTKENNVQSLEEIYNTCDFAIIATGHDKFKEIDLNKFKLVIDGKNLFFNQKTPKHYFGIGR